MIVDKVPVRANEDTPDRTDVVRRRLKDVDVDRASDNDDDVPDRVRLNEEPRAGVRGWEGKEGKGVDLTT